MDFSSKKNSVNISPDEPGAIQKAILTFLETNSQKIIAISKLNYGWEQWLQAEIGYYLSVNLGRCDGWFENSSPALALNQMTSDLSHLSNLDVPVLREEKIYGNEQRVDLVIYYNGWPSHQFEFKCKSRSRNKHEFLNDLWNDWLKLENILIGRNHARAWAIGIWEDDEARKPKLLDQNGSDMLTNWEFGRQGRMNVLLRSQYKGNDPMGPYTDRNKYMSPSNPRRTAKL